MVPPAVVSLLEPLAALPRVDAETWAVTVGVDDDDMLVSIVPAGNASLLVSGLPGTGKTIAAQVLIGAWHAAGAVVRIGDGKDGGDLDAFGTVEQPVIGDDLDGVLALLHGSGCELNKRLAAGKVLGKTELVESSDSRAWPALCADSG